MVQSMTGYASCILEQETYQISIEVKSVNNRFFSLSFRSVGGLDKYEEIIRNIIQKKITRGSINVFIKYKNKMTSNHSQLNVENLSAITKQMQKIAMELHLPCNITFDTLLKVPGVFTEDESTFTAVDEEKIKSFVILATEQATEQLVAMRENEGVRLIATIQSVLQNIIEIENSLKTLFKNSQQEIAEDLFDKVNKTAQLLKSETNFEKKDLVREVALLAERADIAEEINRIKSHITETKKIMSEKGQIGKKLDFLCQEFSREFNTICSKTKKIEISQLALNGKLEVEKIREQVQNIE